MKYFISFLLVLSFVSCDQTQKKSNNLKIDPSYNPEAQLEKLGIQLPEVSPPVANYVRAVKTGNLLFLSGIYMVWRYLSCANCFYITIGALCGALCASLDWISINGRLAPL